MWIVFSTENFTCSSIGSVLIFSMSGRFTDNFFSSYVQLSMSQVRLFSGKLQDTLVLGLRGNTGFSMVF